MNPKKILVVDDDAIIVKTLVMKLKYEGFEVLTASEGSEAVSIVRRDKPDLILLDVNFPPDVGTGLWDGFRIMEWLHRVNEEAKTPIIIISGGDPVKFKQRSLSAGAVAYFRKPIDHAELAKVIRETLGASNTPVEKPATAPN
jgi:DNA-binding response OmpR family regulator